MKETLYACIKTPYSDGKWLMLNEKIAIGEVYRFEGFEFKILSVSEKGYIQLLVYAYSVEHTQLLGSIDDGLGKKIGMKLNSLYLFSNQYADCDYALHFSKTPTDGYGVFSYSGLSDVLPDDNYEETVRYLNKMNRIDSFWELMDYCAHQDLLLQSTKRLEQQTLVYGDAFFSRKNPQKDGFVSFEKNLTLTALQRFSKIDKKTAVLNFANPVEPGGGILRGANAQEEYLCRCTNLYKSLTSKNAENYYAANNRIRSKNQFNSIFIGTDAVIWSPEVVILKKADGYVPTSIFKYGEVYENQYSHTNVLTCAAPFFSGSRYIVPNGDLEYILMKRIKTLFEVAIENNIDVLVLGAFGCGAFHNPPEVVASAFRECLLQPRYRYAFDEVVFSVKREAIPSQNVEVFERYFSGFPFFEENGGEKQLRERIKNSTMEGKR